MNLKQRQITAAAKAMWARDWFIQEKDGPKRLWDSEPESVRQSYEDCALRALKAAAAERQRYEKEAS